MKAIISKLLLISMLFIGGCATGGQTASAPIGGGSVAKWPFKPIPVEGTGHSLFAAGESGNLAAGILGVKGSVMAHVALYPDGMPNLFMGNVEDGENQTGLVIVRLNGDGQPTVGLMGKDRKGLMTTAISGTGQPLLVMVYDADNRGPKATLGFVGEKGGLAPKLNLVADGREASHMLGFTEGKSPVFHMTDSKGRTRVRIGIGQDDAPYIELLDENGKTVWSAK